MSLKEQFESLTIESINFNINDLYTSVWPDLEQITRRESIEELKTLFGERYHKVGKALIRFVFLIELVKVPAIETTKFRVRWFEQLNDDPRYCSFEECIEIFKKMTTHLLRWYSVTENAEAINISLEYNILPYEIPIDYISRFPESGRIHSLDNIEWYNSDTYLKALKLRKYLTSFHAEEDRKFFKAVLIDKIKVKTYLTDRVLTGGYKTNREKRWEAHPSSVHFALRKTCIEIEHRLVTQICSFKDFPREITERLQQDKIIDPYDIALCPITGFYLEYPYFKESLLNPTHGKSDFQVGHLNPLKLSAEDEESGHTAKNISWISADGNRIQGSLSLLATRQLVKDINARYSELGW